MRSVPLSTWNRALRVSAGLLFLGTGVFKLVAPLSPGLPAGLEGFAEFLAAAGVPLPMLGAVAASAVEVLGGVGVALSAFVPALLLPSLVLSSALVVDMAVAVATVGLRAQAGNPVVVRGAAVAAEPWRLVLEVAMLVAMLVVAATTARALIDRRRGAPR